MSLKGLRLIEATERPRKTRTSNRREKLIQQIERQMKLLEAAQRGEHVKGGWWWRLDDGKIAVAARYGKHHLELAKGRHAVVCENFQEASTALDMIRIGIEKGEYEEQLNTLASTIRANFRRE